MAVRTMHIGMVRTVLRLFVRNLAVRGVESAQAQFYDDDQIDLFELIMLLWDKKWLIISTTALFVCVAAIYLRIVQPVYESSAALLPPATSSIAAFNLGRVGRLSDIGASRLKEVSSVDVYSIFIRHLNSGVTKRAFFEGVYADREAIELAELDQKQYESEYSRFLQRLSVQAPNRREEPDFYRVTFSYTDPVLAANWVNSYLALAAQKAIHEISVNISAELSARKETLTLQKATLIERAKVLQEDLEAQLGEALMIAKAVGITEPLMLIGKDHDVAIYEKNMLYLRGSQALEAELSALQQRKEIAPFVNGLREIEAELSYLNSIKLVTDNVTVYTLDESAEIPQTPVKPRSALVLLVALLLGGFLGVAIALLVNAVENYRREGEKELTLV